MNSKQKAHLSEPLLSRIPVGWYFALGAVLVFGLALGLPAWHGARMSKMDMNTPQPLQNKAAQGFSLKDVNGQTYTLTPGDGKTHLVLFYMGYFCGDCRVQVGNLAQSATQLKQAADVVAISVDPASESQKMDQVLHSAFRLLSDPDLRVIRHYQMEMMGGSPMADRGYAIIDPRGIVRVQTLDSNYGDHASKILAQLKAASAP